MAMWQFSIIFIPRKNLLNRYGEIPKTIDEEILWKENLEEGVDLPSNFEDVLNCLGTKKKLKWTLECYNWGDYDNGTHISIDFQNKDKISVDARFHVAEWNEEFVKIVLEFAVLCDCVLLTKNENIIKPELDLFIEEMKNSNSYRFCKNPIEYLQSDKVKKNNCSIRKKLEDNEFDFDC